MTRQRQDAATIDWRWRAVERKNAALDGVFYFAVRTTGIFCRPSCSSRTPRRENVEFFLTSGDARAAGFRACLRCRPESAGFVSPRSELLARAMRLLANERDEVETVADLCGRLGVSSGHLQRTFKTALGAGPKEVMDMMRIDRFKENVRDGGDVTAALYESGFGSSRSLYEKAAERLGMTPAVYKKGGLGLKIAYTIADAPAPLGQLLIATTERGICAVSFGDDAEELLDELRTEFFAAELHSDDARLRPAVDAIVRSLSGEKTILTLPLDLRATAFQLRVWAELRKIPYGETRSYAEIAAAIGNPKAVRAVARACATNPVALVTPCHRVIGSDGRLSGYRWGVERKAKILANEKETRAE
ncbi:MAG: bifunctional DNA-binding transcriptional regulator/O6-methylguanine-DNA methyltransferase Ada [Pyrinomonadaceae bacterium]